MARILFGQSYFLRFDPKLFADRRPYPPLGCLYAAAHVRALGHEVRLFDAMLASTEAEWAEALDRHRPDYAVLYEDNFNYLSKMCLTRMRTAAFAMIRMARARNIPVIVSGADATDHAKSYLAEGAGHVLVGEGEATLAELLDALENRPMAELGAIRGLATRDPRDPSLVHVGTRRPVLRTLDELAFPAWDLVDMDRYRRIWLEEHGHFSLNMVTTRGCPFHCNWCAKPIWGQRHNVRSPKNVADELEMLVDRFHPDHIWFADDIMGLEPGWFARYADELEARRLRVPFKCLSRADLLIRPGEIDALARTGCNLVWMGAESGSQRILDAMDKGTRVEDIVEATRALKSANIRVGYFLQFGFPGEGLPEIETTLELIRAMVPDEIGISVAYPLPGTKFHEMVKAELGRKRNWVDSDDLDMMYRGPFKTAFYRALHALVHKEHQSRLAQRELLAALADPGKLGRRHARRAAGWILRTTTLPLDRRRLQRLAISEAGSIGSLEGRLSHAEAATPSAREG